MSVYLVTWNLNREKPNYSAARTAFVARLDAYDSTADAGLESVRFVSTTETADQIDEYLRAKLDTNDRLVVTRMNQGQHQGWLGKTTWEWINARL